MTLFRENLTASQPAISHKRLPGVSIILVSYNSERYLRPCLEALFQHAYPEYEIIIIDNASKDSSAELVAKEFPRVRLISSETNTGFGGGNNLGAKVANGEFLVFLNVDTQVDPNWLFPLVETLESDPTVGLVTSKILLLNEPDRINTCGNDVHYTGIGYLRGWRNLANTKSYNEEVFGASGAAFAVRKTLYEELGGFDENFFPAYAEDTDLCWRTRLLGYRCLFVHQSTVYHDYTAEFNTNKYFWLERNRYQLLVKNLRWRTLFLILPALILTEYVSWGFACLNGFAYVRAKLRSYGWLIQNLTPILQARRQVQATRKVKDQDILKQCSYRLAYGQTGEGLVAQVGRLVFDPLFYVIYRLCMLVIRW